MTDHTFTITRGIARPIAEITPILADISNWPDWCQAIVSVTTPEQGLQAGAVFSLNLDISRTNKTQRVPMTFTIDALPDDKDASPMLALSQSAPLKTLDLTWRFSLSPLSETSTHLEITLAAQGWLSGLLWPGFSASYQHAMEKFAADLRRQVDAVGVAGQD